MSAKYSVAMGVVTFAILAVAVVLGLLGVNDIAGLPVLSAGPFASGYLAAGDFAVGVFGAGTFAIGFFASGIFSVGFFSAGVFSIGIFSIGIFSIGVNSIGIYALGIYVARKVISASQTRPQHLRAGSR